MLSSLRLLGNVRCSSRSLVTRIPIHPSIQCRCMFVNNNTNRSRKAGKALETLQSMEGLFSQNHGRGERIRRSPRFARLRGLRGSPAPWLSANWGSRCAPCTRARSVSCTCSTRSGRRWRIPSSMRMSGREDRTES
jgi:hypothetical protein